MGIGTSLPSPPLLFIAFSTPHRSPLSERLEQAMYQYDDLIFILFHILFCFRQRLNNYFFPLVNVSIINFDLVMELYSGKYPQNTCLYQMHVRDVLIRQTLSNFERRFRKLSS